MARSINIDAAAVVVFEFNTGQPPTAITAANTNPNAKKQPTGSFVRPKSIQQFAVSANPHHQGCQVGSPSASGTCS